MSQCNAEHEKTNNSSVIIRHINVSVSCLHKIDLEWAMRTQTESRKKRNNSRSWIYNDAHFILEV